MKQQTKKEEVLKRQMKLFQLIKDWGGNFFMSNGSIKSKMSQYSYTNLKTITRDLNTLEQKFLITRETKFNGERKVRTIKIVNHNKELLSQCNYDYLEGLALANPDCFLIKWRDGYKYYEGGVQKYVDYIKECPNTYSSNITIGKQWYGTGVWLLEQPSNLLSSAPIKSKSYKYDTESIGQEIDQPIPF